MSDLDSLLEQFKQPRGAALPPEADQPPLFAELLGGDTERAIHLLQDGADAHHTLPCGLTALHAAVLGGEGPLTAEGSRLALVMPTNEELVIARHALSLVG